nr:hypothetical protein [Tanacetum cinerariifolium]
PLSPWSSPPPQIPFPPLPPILSPPSPVLSPAPPPRPIRAPVSTDTELGEYVREFETRVRQDTDEIYMRLDDEQTERQLLAGRLNMLFRDRCAHAYTRHLMETEKQMAQRRTTRLTADQETINATSVTNAQLQAMIDQGVTAALAARDALRSTNDDDSHNSGTGVRRTERANSECTYIDFLKCQPLPFKGTEGVASLSQWCERMESVFYISNCAAKNNWRPVGWNFTLVGNACPLTRTTATNKVPLREPITLEVVAQESVVTKVYTRRPQVPKTNGSNRKPKIAKSMISNKTEPDTSRGSNTSVAPSSSSIDLRLSKFFYGIWTLDAPSTWLDIAFS